MLGIYINIVSMLCSLMLSRASEMSMFNTISCGQSASNLKIGEYTVESLVSTVIKLTN